MRLDLNQELVAMIDPVQTGDVLPAELPAHVALLGPFAVAPEFGNAFLNSMSNLCLEQQAIQITAGERSADPYDRQRHLILIASGAGRVAVLGQKFASKVESYDGPVFGDNGGRDQHFITLSATDRRIQKGAELLLGSVQLIERDDLTRPSEIVVVRNFTLLGRSRTR